MSVDMSPPRLHPSPRIEVASPFLCKPSPFAACAAATESVQARSASPVTAPRVTAASCQRRSTWKKAHRNDHSACTDRAELIADSQRPIRRSGATAFGDRITAGDRG